VSVCKPFSHYGDSLPGGLQLTGGSGGASILIEDLLAGFAAEFLNTFHSEFVVRWQRKQQADPDADPNSCGKAQNVSEDVVVISTNGSRRFRNSVSRIFILLPDNLAEIINLTSATAAHFRAIRLLKQIKAGAE
jgi:hypothetical protein